MFAKDDLKNCDVVVLKNGKRYTVNEEIPTGKYSADDCIIIRV